MNEHSFEGASRSSPARDAASAGPTHSCSPQRGARVVVNDLGGSMEGEGADAGPAAAVAAEIVARRRRRDRRHQRRVDGGGRAGARRRRGRAVRAHRHPGQQRRHHPLGRLPEADADNLARHLAVHVGGSFNTDPRRVAAHGRTGLRPHRDDDVGGDVRPARTTSRTPPPRAGSSGSRAASRPRAPRTASRSTPSRPRRSRAWPSGRRRGRAAADAAGAGRADGRVPRPRGLPGHRRDLRRGRRPLRAHLHRVDRGLRARGGRARRSRTSPSTGRRSTTRPATPSRPTSWTGRPRSWRTCRQADRSRSSRFRTLPDGFLGSASTNTTSFGTLNCASCPRQCSMSSSGVVGRGRLEDDVRDGHLAPALVGPADDRGLDHRLVLVEHPLDLGARRCSRRRTRSCP